jgi:hypothetical protein
MKKKSLKICKLSTCKKPLLLCKEPVNGCCNEAHFRLWKKEYNANYYSQKNEVVLNAKYSVMLRSCLRQFGEDVPFDAEILNLMGFDWEFSNQQIEIGNYTYNVIGEYGYIVFATKKIKIKKL